jgi:hypothetical protein
MLTIIRVWHLDVHFLVTRTAEVISKKYLIELTVNKA